MRLLPEILGEERRGERIALELRVPPDLAYFEGHFPGLPILPGVVQIHWSVGFARERFSLRGRFAAAENLKFLAIVRPDARLTLTLEAEKDTRLTFNYFSRDKKYSSGTLVFGA
jgi:3-hydroxymyristoyl/3-hydroxydecanoyl-(acyl carrier protein) dehydratase